MARPRVYKTRPGPKRKTLADIEAGPVTVIPEPTADEGPCKAVRASYSNKRKSAIIIWHYTHQILRWNERKQDNVLCKPRHRDTWTHFHAELKSQGVPFSTMSGWLDRKMADKILSSKASLRSYVDSFLFTGRSSCEDNEELRERCSGGFYKKAANTKLEIEHQRRMQLVISFKKNREDDEDEEDEDEEMKEIPSEGYVNPSQTSSQQEDPPVSRVSSLQGAYIARLVAPPGPHSLNSRPVSERIQEHGHILHDHSIPLTSGPAAFRTVRGSQPLKGPCPPALQLPHSQHMHPPTNEQQKMRSFHPPMPSPNTPHSPLGLGNLGPINQSSPSEYLAQLPPPPSGRSQQMRHQIVVSQPVPTRHPISLAELEQRPKTCPPGSQNKRMHPVELPREAQPAIHQQQPNPHQRTSSMVEPSAIGQLPKINPQGQSLREGQVVNLPPLVSQVPLIPQRLQLATQQSPTPQSPFPQSPIPRSVSQPQSNHPQWPIRVEEIAPPAPPTSQHQIPAQGRPPKDKGPKSPLPQPQPQTAAGIPPSGQPISTNHGLPNRPWVPPPPRVIEYLPAQRRGPEQPPSNPRPIFPRVDPRKKFMGACHCETVRLSVTCKPLPNPTHALIACTCKTCLMVCFPFPHLMPIRTNQTIQRQTPSSSPASHKPISLPR